MGKGKRDKWGAEVTKALQEAIRVSDLSQNEIARRAGIDSGMVCRFVNGERGVSCKAMDALGECLGLRFTTRPAPKHKAKKGRR